MRYVIRSHNISHICSNLTFMFFTFFVLVFLCFYIYIHFRFPICRPTAPGAGCLPKLKIIKGSPFCLMRSSCNVTCRRCIHRQHFRWMELSCIIEHTQWSLLHELAPAPSSVTDFGYWSGLNPNPPNLDLPPPLVPRPLFPPCIQGVKHSTFTALCVCVWGGGGG